MLVPSDTIHQMLENTIILPSFNILHKGVKSPTLIHSFLIRTTISLRPVPQHIKAKNGEVYRVYWDMPSLPDVDSIQAIISFQKHTYGNFAVIRLLNSDSNKGENNAQA